MSDDLIIRSDMPTVDRCPVLTRVKAFIAQQGVKSWVEHRFVDRDGLPINLSAMVPGTSLSDSVDSVDESEFVGSIRVRVMESLGLSVNNSKNPIYDLIGEVYDAEEGIARVQLTADIVEYAGVYDMQWGVLDEAVEPVLVNRTILMVEHTLFTENPYSRQKTKGPPTMQKIRMHMMDSSPNENTLLQDVEFSDGQILDAILKPVQIWNEALPRLKMLMTTKNFPFYNQWLEAIVGQLFITAAHNYRRNNLQYQVGGGTINDKNMEGPYLQMGQMMMQAYRDFVLNHKTSRNLRSMFDHFGSDYAGSGY